MEFVVFFLETGKSDQEPICKEITTLKAQLQCGAKGHGKWVFVKKDLCFHRNSPEITGYIFKCQDCGLEITKTKKELTAKEKEGLTKLGLL